MSFRYANFYKRETRWKIAIEAFGMIAFITWVLWYSERLASPLTNLYLLPVLIILTVLIAPQRPSAHRHHARRAAPSARDQPKTVTFFLALVLRHQQHS